jgi:cytochrome c peroxidase
MKALSRPYLPAPTRIGLLAAAVSLSVAAVAQSPGDERAARAAARAEARSHVVLDPEMQAILEGKTPPTDPVKRAKEALGRQIFRDTALSEPPGQSCETCHHTGRAFTSKGATSEGANPTLFGPRNAPSITYSMFTPPLQSGGDDGANGYFGGQFRDGRADFLQNQVAFPMLNPIEMGNPDAATIIAKVAAASYAPQFQQIYGSGIFSKTNAAFADLADAVATYERGPDFRRFDSKFDAYRRGETTLTDSEARGLAIFNDPNRSNCASCHLTGRDKIIGPRPVLTDFGYDNIGVPRNPENRFYRMPPEINPDGRNFVDQGLNNVVPMGFTMGQFKSPSLRNVAVSGPYMHNGYFKTLRGVLDFYNTRDVKPRCADKFTSEANAEAQGCWPEPEQTLNENTVDLGNLKLSDQDIDDMLAFLGTLTDGWSETQH